MTISEYIKEYRRRMGISQRELARRTSLSNAYISMIENEINPVTKTKPIISLEALNKLASGMDTTLTKLIEEVDDCEIIMNRQLNPGGIEMLQIRANKSASEELVKLFCSLNNEGQDKLIEYAELLQNKYRRD